MDSPETSNISCRANAISPTGVKKSASVQIIHLEDCKEVIMTWGNSVIDDPDSVVQPALEQWFLNSLRTKQTVFAHQEVVVEYTHPGAQKSN